MEPLSDHTSLNVELALPTQKHSPLVKAVYDYSRANVDDFCRSLQSFSSIYMVGFDCRTVHKNWRLFKQKLLDLCDQFIPKMNIPSSVEKPWFSNRLKRLINKKTETISNS